MNLDKYAAMLLRVVDYRGAYRPEDEVGHTCLFVMLVWDWCNLSESQIIPVEDAIASTACNLTFRNSPI